MTRIIALTCMYEEATDCTGYTCQSWREVFNLERESVQMGNENHMKNAGDSFAKGAKRAQDEAAHGNVTNAVGAAVEGTTTAAAELAKSAAAQISQMVNPDTK